MTTPTTERPFEILLVEDNPGDVRLTQEALKRVQLRVNLSVANNGEGAMAFLRRQGPYSNAARPDLILLDLNMHETLHGDHHIVCSVQAEGIGADWRRAHWNISIDASGRAF